MQKYVVEGDPIPLARPRHGRGRTWDAQSKFKHDVALQIMAQHGSKPMFQGPVEIDVTFYMPIAASKSQKQQRLLEDHMHIARPDLSNLIKFIEDVATSIIYSDDCIICCIVATKRYSSKPRTEFIIKELR